MEGLDIEVDTCSQRKVGVDGVSRLQTLTESIFMAAASPFQVCYQAPLAFQNSLTEREDTSAHGLPPIPSGK